MHTGTMGLGVVYPHERPTREYSLKLVHRALEMGVGIFDTADTYCRDEGELHYCERLLAEALATAPPGLEDRAVCGAWITMCHIHPSTHPHPLPTHTHLPDPHIHPYTHTHTQEKALIITKGGMDRAGADSTGWRPAGGEKRQGGCLCPDQAEARIRASHAALVSTTR